MEATVLTATMRTTRNLTVEKKEEEEDIVTKMLLLLLSVLLLVLVPLACPTPAHNS